MFVKTCYEFRTKVTICFLSFRLLITSFTVEEKFSNIQTIGVAVSFINKLINSLSEVFISVNSAQFSISDFSVIIEHAIRTKVRPVPTTHTFSMETFE
jgi:hypothetical protein